MRWADTRSVVLSVAHPEVIYAHARNFTSVFFTNLLKMSLNVGLQAKFSRDMQNPGRWIHFRWQIGDRK